jgi:D-aspartate ligase
VGTETALDKKPVSMECPEEIGVRAIRPSASRALDTSVPVVVLQPDHCSSLCLIRSLGRLGIPVYGVGANPHSPGMVSRYCRVRFLYSANGTGARELVRFLGEVSRKLGRRPILTCASDVASIFVAENKDALRDGFLFPNMPAELVWSLYDKKKMHFLCKRFGISTAETIFPQSRQEVVDVLESGQAVLPIVLKGIDGDLLERRGAPRMVIVSDPQELLEKYDQMEGPTKPNLMLQEYIPGVDWMFNGYFNRNSDCVLGFTGLKLRQFPPYSGATLLGVCLRNEMVEGITKNLMRSIGYQGVLDIDYRFDPRNGLYKVLDINPRVGLAFRLFLAANGMDVVRAMYLDLTGQPVPLAAGREGRKWVAEDSALMSFRYYKRDRKLTFMKWVCSFRGVEEAAWFAWDDLVPFGLMFVNLLRRGVRWIGHQLLPARVARRKQ